MAAFKNSVAFTASSMPIVKLSPTGSRATSSGPFISAIKASCRRKRAVSPAWYIFFWPMVTDHTGRRAKILAVRAGRAVMGDGKFNVTESRTVLPPPI